MRSNRNRSLLFLLAAVLLVLAIGWLRVHDAFQTRGMPAGLPGAMAHGVPRLGINVYLEQYDEAALADNLAAIQQAGIATIKQSFYFDEAFDWAASDRLVAAAAEHELQLVALLDGSPAEGFAPPADPAVFAEWAGEFANRYADQLTYYIVWDEPNLGSHWGGQPVNPAAYAALITAAAQAIRAADGDAVIVAAPLAPTTEVGTANLADPLYLEGLYQAGAADAFDVVAAKPYGFEHSSAERTVDLDTLNFSRVILLREVMEQYGDVETAVWAGNWGWNSLPEGWQGEPSIWGEVDGATQAEWTLAALERARREWPWMGFLFLENWQPAAPLDDPHWGFSVAERPIVEAMGDWQAAAELVAYPGFHPATPRDPKQQYSGAWKFGSGFGADIGQNGDRLTLRFWGTDVGVRVRKADYHGRFYVTIDGEPANALPADENGAALVLTSAAPGDDSLEIVPVASGLEPGEHTLELVAEDGNGQWALNGFSVAYHQTPPSRQRMLTVGLSLLAVLLLGLAVWDGRRADWGSLGRVMAAAYSRLGQSGQVVLTLLAAVLVALTGWLTWGEQVAGVYRRLGDGGQLAATIGAATLFYVAPSFLIYLPAVLLLLVLLYFRPAWGLALVAFTMPFYVNPNFSFLIRPKPMLGYRFSPVEIYLWVTVGAFVLSRIPYCVWRIQKEGVGNTLYAIGNRLRPTDYAALAFTVVATLSLLFTERLDVATNEWRMVVIEPFLFYLLLRFIGLEKREMWTVLDAFVLGGVVVALVGLWQYAAWRTDLLITSEGGLMRLRSIYGSPNNVALYLGRILPLTLAVALMGTNLGRRRVAYALAMVLIGPAILLSFSKGGLLLGVPAALFVILVYWQRAAGRPVWPWLVGAGVAGILALVIAFQIPQLAGRLDPRGATGTLRLNLWQASVNMFLEHPIFGVGLDNFLYAHRGRYIFDAAWQEPNLNHPHNVLLDFATRLGLAGVVMGAWLFWSFWRTAAPLPQRVEPEWRPVAIGLLAAFAHLLAHSLVDHSYFLVDLAFSFYLMLGTVVWLRER
jgi:O-antigen ligase